jgi:hypothetical protein
VTVEELERDLDLVADLIAQGRESLLPIYERLEEEKVALEKRMSALDRARRRVVRPDAACPRAA